MKLYRAFATVGGLTLVSRVLGFMRDIAFAWGFGAGMVADAFAVATAVEFDAILLTGDPEIEPLEGEQNLQVEWLPTRS